MAFATAADLVIRFDARSIGRLASDDGAPVPPTEFASNPVINAALNDAAAQILVVLSPGRRYTEAELLADQSASGVHYLTMINCHLAYAHLWMRRDMTEDNEKKYRSVLETAERYLDELRTGKHVLVIEDKVDAGLPRTQPLSVQVIENEWELLRDKLGYLPNRRGLR